MRLRGSVAMLWRNCWTKLLAHEPRLALADDVDSVTDVGAKGGIVGLEATNEVVTPEGSRVAWPQGQGLCMSSGGRKGRRSLRLEGKAVLVVPLIRVLL